MTPYGLVDVPRGLFRDIRNAPTICPMELAAGVVESFWTPRAAKLAALAVADTTPYRASQFFAELGGMRPSRSALDRLPKALSRRWEENREAFEGTLRESLEIPEEATSMSVSIDGVMVPMRAGQKEAKKQRMRSQGRPDKGPAGYREVGCGAISFYDDQGERLRTLRYARMPEPKMATLKTTLRAEVEHCRASRPDLTVVAAADGDHTIWAFLDSLKPDEAVVDFYHAAEHLKHALDLAYGASAVGTQKRYAILRERLLKDTNGASSVVRSLAQKPAKRSSKSAEYRRGVNYFKRHKNRMRYADLSRRKLPIGSGVVEGTCKSLASDRLKRAGMRWDTKGGQAILTLRAQVNSDRFGPAWRLVADTYRQPIALAA